jgi:hypothetical protein
MQHKVQHCAVAFIPLQSQVNPAQEYKLNSNAEIRNTIFIYRQRKVIDKFVNYESDDVKQLLANLAL